MKCCEFDRRLQHLLDERMQNSLGADELPKPLRVHLKHCSDCAELLGGYRALFDVLTTASPASSSFRAADVVELTSSRHRRFGWRRAVASLATAASLLMAARLVMQPGGPDAVPQPKVVPPIVGPQFATSSPLDSKAHAHPVAFASPMEIDERSFELMLNLAGLSTVTFPAELLDAHMLNTPAWMVQVSDGLRPVTERMTGTLNALFRALPGADAAKDQSHGARYKQHNPRNLLV